MVVSFSLVSFSLVCGVPGSRNPKGGELLVSETGAEVGLSVSITGFGGIG